MAGVYNEEAHRQADPSRDHSGRHRSASAPRGGSADPVRTGALSNATETTRRSNRNGQRRVALPAEARLDLVRNASVS